MSTFQLLFILIDYVFKMRHQMYLRTQAYYMYQYFMYHFKTEIRFQVFLLDLFCI